MMRRAVLAGVFAAGVARAQEAPGELPANVPAAPPPAPPPPVQLAPQGAPVQPSPVPAESLPAGMDMLPGGGVRVALGSGALEASQVRALEALGRAFAALPAGRITVEAQVSGPANDASMARRASLARAQAVKAALVAGGLAPTRIDLRPLGRLAAGADRVDVLPPGVASPNAEARGQ